MEEKEKPSDDYFKTIKVSLKHIIKHPEINIPKISNGVMKAHKIIIYTLQFLKLYFINYYNINHSLPKIDKVLINCVMKILCQEQSRGRPPKKEIRELKEKLTDFYNLHYQPFRQNEDLDYTHLNTVLDYLTIDILTMYENNIKQRYVEYIERYINCMWKKKFFIDKIRKVFKTKKERESRIRKLNAQLINIKNDILNVENTKYKSHIMYHSWINEQKKHILPQKKKFKKDNLYYDLQCTPQEYLPCMVFMNKMIEKEGFKINNVFPLRNHIIPKHIRLDTTTLVHLLMRKDIGNKTEFLTNGNLKRYEDRIWKFFFRTEMKCFHKLYYNFHHMIETDGVSASILLLREDLVGKRISIKIKPNNEKYIEELSDYNDLQNKKIVTIDPGKEDLIYCVDGDTREATEFRYSQDQRRKETKSKKYAKIILEYKQSMIYEKNIIDYETELSKFNHKTLNLEDFKKYIQKKNEINIKLFDFYQNFLFRKLKLNGYWNRKRSEQKLINRFKNIFGNPNETIICFGDFEQKKHMKFKEPIKGKGMRTLFRKSGYQTYLVDEFRTSCKCSKCEGGECIKFMIRSNPKPFRDNLRLSHGLLKCKTCDGVWNRDCNGATNIYKIALNSINGLFRPEYLARGKISDVLDDTS